MWGYSNGLYPGSTSQLSSRPTTSAPSSVISTMASSLVGPSPVGPARERVRLRDTYKQAALSIIESLQSRSKPTYTHTDLAQFGFSVQSFDPEDPEFTDSEACLFQPLTPEELEEFEDTFNEFPQTYSVPEHCRMWDRASQISFCLEIFESSYKKEMHEDTVSIRDVSYWDNIKAEDSFHDTGDGMLLGVTIGHSTPQTLPMWHTDSTCQWLDENLKTTRPHIKLVTLTGAEAKENELLHGELGSISNAIYCRLNQPEFETTSIFPVLMLSLFGPRHGRLLQAKFHNSGTLNVQSSPIYNFVDSNEKMKLFVRYNNCKPRDSKESEPVLIAEDSPAPRVQHPASLLESNKGTLSLVAEIAF
ncbi:unnamed protein product [Penicillium egyptiacum]|uniref:Uncharacterized protein n=1 Tax=Penicillium egyptiacum TaxID=1303716 RepID=A0A9W4KFE0_9EURO|nr:unnamed protein product [Penicillium egyptiacum]